MNLDEWKKRKFRIGEKPTCQNILPTLQIGEYSFSKDGDNLRILDNKSRVVVVNIIQFNNLINDFFNNNFKSGFNETLEKYGF
ncbi:MAG: hypothetical protein GY853_13220 [PVC group bacterium]|nr:hypothetical protein [PVC group bacterium]